MPRKLKELIAAFFAAQVGTYGAAVAYYTIFSLAPILIIILAITGIFFDASQVQANILAQFTNTFGSGGAAFVQTLLSASKPTSANLFITAFGVVSIFLGATGIFSALQSGLDKIFESFPDKKEESLLKKILRNLASVGMILSLGFALIVSLVASTALSALGSKINAFMPDGEAIAIALDFGVSFLLTASFMSLTLKYLPSKRIAWRPAILGGIIATFFFLLGKYALGHYLGSSKIADPYGAASSLVLLILWAYYIAQTFFFSAIVAKIYFRR